MVLVAFSNLNGCMTTWFLRELGATWYHGCLRYRLQVLKENPSPAFMPWKKVPPLSNMPPAHSSHLDHEGTSCPQHTCIGEDAQTQQGITAHTLIYITVPLSLCSLHAELQPAHVYHQRMCNTGPEESISMCKLCRMREEGRNKRIKAWKSWKLFYC